MSKSNEPSWTDKLNPLNIVTYCNDTKVLTETGSVKFWMYGVLLWMP